MTIERIKIHKDGRKEVMTPHRYDDGYKVLITVTDKAEMEKLVLDGAGVRMSGPLSTNPAIVTPYPK